MEEAGVAKAWQMLGLKLEPLNEAERKEITSKVYNGPRGQVRYNGGMRVREIRSDSQAARFMKEGDVLLGLNGFETLTSANLEYLLEDSRVAHVASLKCQIYRRGSVPLEGVLQLTKK